MKTENRTMYKFMAVWALMILCLWGCKDEMNKTGYDLLLPGDLISANKAIFNKNAIQAYTVRDDKLNTSKPANNLLGTFVDPVFGKTTASFACQFRISDVPKFKQGDHIDSLVFYMTYSSLYGDTVTAQNIKAYELSSDLKYEDNTTYYQDIDLKSMSSSEVLGEINHRPRHRDSIYVAKTDTSGSYKQRDTITVRIVLDKDKLGQKLMDATFAAFAADPEDPNMSFLNLFKGLYLEPGDLTQGGAIVSMKPRALIMYTPKPTTATDTVKAEYATYYDVTKMAARVNRFDHYGYSTTSFVTHLDQQTQLDSLIYLQSTGGLSSKIYIPDIDNWIKDSTDVAINKAELIFTVDSSFSDKRVYTLPPKLILGLINDTGAITDSTGQLIKPADLTFSESYYGGAYNKKDGTYRFNLAGHLQKLIKEKDKADKERLKNKGFYLTTDNKNSVFSRVVLKGVTSKTGVRFEVTYSKVR